MEHGPTDKAEANISPELGDELLGRYIVQHSTSLAIKPLPGQGFTIMSLEEVRGDARSSRKSRVTTSVRAAVKALGNNPGSIRYYSLDLPLDRIRELAGVELSEGQGLSG